jgi:hypothetical protein
MFRSIIDRSLYWADLDELNAWKASHPDDLRGQVVEYIAKAATA